MKQEVSFSEQYLHGIELFNREKYYEAHEAWEEIWLRSEGEKKRFYQSLIQAAAALLHHTRNNRVGAKICITKSLDKLDSLPSPYLALNTKDFISQLKNFFAYLETDIEPPRLVKTPTIELQSR